MGPRAGLDWCGKSRPHQDVFVFSFCILSVLLCPDFSGCLRFYPLLYNTHTHTTQTTMPPAEFEPAIPASERPQILAFGRSATGIWFPVRQVRSESLFQLRSSGPPEKIVVLVTLPRFISVEEKYWKMGRNDEVCSDKFCLYVYMDRLNTCIWEKGCFVETKRCYILSHWHSGRCINRQSNTVQRSNRLHSKLQRFWGCLKSITVRCLSNRQSFILLLKRQWRKLIHLHWLFHFTAVSSH
jgi:hypothetical protein